MDSDTTTDIQESYWTYYQNEIVPKYKDIDVFIKCGDKITCALIARHLDLDIAETMNIIKMLKIENLNKNTFFQIMENGSSEICKLYQREKECGSPFVYTREEIAYIYNINLDLINKTCDRLNFIELTSYSLPELFLNIPLHLVNIHN